VRVAPIPRPAQHRALAPARNLFAMSEPYEETETAPMAPDTARPQSPVVHGTYEAQEDGDEDVMVKTEFVWADGAEQDVKLSGAWNGWMPVQMYHEGGGMWSVVTPVPAGTHEFKFVVDGVWKHSSRHPTVGEDEDTMNNIRVIRGPPKHKPTNDEPAAEPAQDTAANNNVPPPKKGCCVIS
jgi:Glycogen recognition site of AMP-activated protein kinase